MLNTAKEGSKKSGGLPAKKLARDRKKKQEMELWKRRGKNAEKMAAPKAVEAKPKKAAAPAKAEETK